MKLLVFLFVQYTQEVLQFRKTKSFPLYREKRKERMRWTGNTQTIYIYSIFKQNLRLSKPFQHWNSIRHLSCKSYKFWRHFTPLNFFFVLQITGGQANCRLNVYKKHKISITRKKNASKKNGSTCQHRSKRSFNFTCEVKQTNKSMSVAYHNFSSFMLT